MKRITILVCLFCVSPVLALIGKEIGPRWVRINQERIFELRRALSKVAYPTYSDKLIMKLGLDFSTQWLDVSHPERPNRHFEYFAISDPKATGGYYRLEFEMKDDKMDRTKDEVIRARLSFVTSEGIIFYADELNQPGEK